jgi:hypothetical protein
MNQKDIDALRASIEAVNRQFRRFAGDACCPGYQYALRDQARNRAEAERLMPGAGFFIKRMMFPGL